MFSPSALKEMLTLQYHLNSGMAGDDWLRSETQAVPFYRAAAVEANEAIDHYGYKWWKKFDREANIGQVKLELVDIGLFVLSDEMRNTYRRHEADVLVDGTLQLEKLVALTAERISELGVIELVNGTTDPEERFLQMLERFAASCTMTKSATVRQWGGLLDAINFSAQEVTLWYVGKAALNFLRDSNGQKQNTYTKIWWGVEDNVYLESFILRLQGTDLPEGTEFYPLFNRYLEEQYRRLMSGESALDLNTYELAS